MTRTNLLGCDGCLPESGGGAVCYLNGVENITLPITLLDGEETRPGFHAFQDPAGNFIAAHNYLFLSVTDYPNAVGPMVRFTVDPVTGNFTAASRVTFNSPFYTNASSNVLVHPDGNSLLMTEMGYLDDGPAWEEGYYLRKLDTHTLCTIAEIEPTKNLIPVMMIGSVAYFRESNWPGASTLVKVDMDGAFALAPATEPWAASLGAETYAVYDPVMNVTIDPITGNVYDGVTGAIKQNLDSIPGAVNKAVNNERHIRLPTHGEVGGYSPPVVMWSTFSTNDPAVPANGNTGVSLLRRNLVTREYELQQTHFLNARGDLGPLFDESWVQYGNGIGITTLDGRLPGTDAEVAADSSLAAKKLIIGAGHSYPDPAYSPYGSGTHNANPNLKVVFEINLETGVKTKVYERFHDKAGNINGSIDPWAPTTPTFIATRTANKTLVWQGHWDSNTPRSRLVFYTDYLADNNPLP